MVWTVPGPGHHTNHHARRQARWWQVSRGDFLVADQEVTDTVLMRGVGVVEASARPVPPRSATRIAAHPAYGADVSLASDVAGQLRAAPARTAAARTGATANRIMAEELIAKFQAATDGSTDDKPAEAIVRLRQSQERLGEATIEFDAGGRGCIADGLGGGGSSFTTLAPAPSNRVTSPAYNRESADRPHLRQGNALTASSCGMVVSYRAVMAHRFVVRSRTARSTRTGRGSRRSGRQLRQ